MKLDRHDWIELDGVFAKNPVTGAPTPYLQSFAVTESVEGDVIPRRALYPFVTPIDEPIPMSRVITVNLRSVELQSFVDKL